MDSYSAQLLAVTSFIVVITILVTVALAAISYFAFRMRERRRPVWTGTADGSEEPRFFERVTMADDGQQRRALPVGAATAAERG